MAWQRVKIKIPENYKPSEREAIADEVIDYIIERTKSGRDKNNEAFPKYSESYKKSLDFKIAGKSNKVDLTLSGDMLASISLLNHKRGEITVGFDRGDKENNDKATGHITGFYGRSKEQKIRDFLGITDNDLEKKILSNYPIDDQDQRETRTEEQLRARRRLRDF